MSLPDGSVDPNYWWQTKDLICYMEKYEIREVGTMWHEEYDTEDHSDPNAEGILRLDGISTKVNQRWVRDNYSGVIWMMYFDEKREPKSKTVGALFSYGELLHWISTEETADATQANSTT